MADRGLVVVCMLVLGAARAVAQPATDSLPLFAPLDTSQAIGLFVADSTGVAGSRRGDAEICRWALDDWLAAADGRFVVESAAEASAQIRVYFVGPGSGQYGEMRPIVADGRRGAEVFVRPDTDALGPAIAAAARADPLVRDAIVYLTCLHELGHALGLEHTGEFADIMYFFGFGGDIVEYFGRYRARLSSRDDIPRVSGLSENDVRRLLASYPNP